MTTEEIAELLAHPRVQEFIDLRIRRAQVQPRLVVVRVRGKRPPKGYLTYKDAAARAGVQVQTIRLWISGQKVTGGSGLVSIQSLDSWCQDRR